MLDRTQPLTRHWIAALLMVGACNNSANSSSPLLTAGTSGGANKLTSAGNAAQTAAAVGGSTGSVAGSPGGLLGSAGRLSGASGGAAAGHSGSSAQLDSDAGPAADGGELSAGGHAAGGSGGASGDVDTRPPCEKKASQVILFGDSYVSWVSHNFPTDLAKETGETYRNYAVGGYSLGSGGIGKIGPELDQAIAADPDIIAAIGDGGGNDLLVPDPMWMGADQCKTSAAPTLKVCQDIVKTGLAAGRDLMAKAASAGIKDVVYFYYPRVPSNTVLGGADPNALLEYSKPMAKDFCDNVASTTGGKLRCHFLDLVPVFDGHPEWFVAGDIHPNPQGSIAMAKAVVQVMKDNCIAQHASSGCCAP
jgi:hypothetical protein